CAVRTGLITELHTLAASRQRATTREAARFTASTEEPDVSACCTNSTLCWTDTVPPRCKSDRTAIFTELWAAAFTAWVRFPSFADRNLHARPCFFSRRGQRPSLPPCRGFPRQLVWRGVWRQLRQWGDLQDLAGWLLHPGTSIRWFGRTSGCSPVAGKRRQFLRHHRRTTGRRHHFPHDARRVDQDNARF